MGRNKSVLIFLLKFLGTYFLLFLLYNTYLNKTQHKEAPYRCAPITETVADQTVYILNVLGYEARSEQKFEELSIKLIINDAYIATIIEGCNSISVIILFIAFIIAFASSFKRTALYILFGSLTLYLTNILRIAIIAILFIEIPEYQDFVHDYLFPGIIYGMTFILWLLWIKKFSGLKK